MGRIQIRARRGLTTRGIRNWPPGSFRPRKAHPGSLPPPSLPGPPPIRRLPSPILRTPNRILWGSFRRQHRLPRKLSCKIKKPRLLRRLEKLQRAVRFDRQRKFHHPATPRRQLQCCPQIIDARAASPRTHGSAFTAAINALMYPNVYANAKRPFVSPGILGTWSGMIMPS